jgi:hypothetical protein
MMLWSEKKRADNLNLERKARRHSQHRDPRGWIRDACNRGTIPDLAVVSRHSIDCRSTLGGWSFACSAEVGVHHNNILLHPFFTHE